MDYYGGFNQFTNQLTPYTQQIKAVHGMEGAKATPVNSGCSVILPDDCERIMWFISADSFGIKTVTGYPYGDPIGTPVQQPQQNQQTQTAQQDAPIYVQQKEFDDLKSCVTDMKTSLDKLMEELK